MKRYCNNCVPLKAASRLSDKNIFDDKIADGAVFIIAEIHRIPSLPSEQRANSEKLKFQIRCDTAI